MDKEMSDKSTLVSKWNSRISDAMKREEKWRKDAKSVVSIFECDKPEEIPYNVLYANVQILSPSIYNRPPKPIVKRKYNDKDILAKMSSEVVRRLLIYFIDDSDPTYPTVDSLMSSAVMEGLVPGRGNTRVKYDMELSGEGDNERVEYETICGEEIPWDRLVHGYGKKWCDVPWICIVHYKTKAEVEELIEDKSISEAILEEIQFSYEDEALKKEDSRELDSTGDIKLARIYEIWDKVNKKIIFIAGGYTDAPIKETDDSFNLTGFYPIPEPIKFFKRISGLLPQILYKTYENQAKELNKVTRRINAITDALKVRGAYDASIEVIGQIATLDDNTLVAAQNVVNLEGRKLEDAIFLMPLSELITVLQQLYANREQVKSVIFEISGIADIMRGSTAASETLGAQNLKSQWGSMRLREMQKEAARYCRDYLRIMAELGITKLSQDTIIGITNLEYPTNEDRMGMQAQLAQLQQQVMAMSSSIQQLPPEQAQQVQPQIDELNQQMQQLQSQIAIPTWEEILGLLRNDLMRAYRIDIETNSTIEVEASEDKQEVAEFMNGFSQLLNGLAPLVENGTMPFEASKTMMMAVVRKFKFGEEVEEQLEAMTEPKPKPDPAQEALAQKTQLENQKLQSELEYKQQENQMKMQSAQLDMQIKQENARQDNIKAEQDMKVSMAEHTAKMIEIARKGDIDEMKFKQNMAKIARANAVDQAKAESAIERSNDNATV